MSNINTLQFNNVEVNVSELLSLIDGYNEETIVIAYTSYLDGLGTKNSDIDLYVIDECLPGIRYRQEKLNTSTYVKKLGKIMIDIKCWEKNHISDLLLRLTDLNNDSIDSDELKMIYRLRKGMILSNDKAGELLKANINFHALKQRVKHYYIVNAQSEFHDASNLYKAGEYECAIVCARNALQSAIGAYNTHNDVINMKEKWIPKLFISKFSRDDQFVKRYLSLLFYNCINADNIKSEVEKILEFTQELLLKIRFDEGV